MTAVASGAPSAAAPAGRIDEIQLLRTVAAAMIVLLHTQMTVHLYAAKRGLDFTAFDEAPLGAGVDIFFVISGFIIVYASRSLFAGRNATEFLRRRVLRIAPMYWLALSIKLGMLAAAAAIGMKAFPTAAMIVTSYLFIPYDSMGFGPAYPFPIIDLGWSLNYEMFFYGLFALVIGFQRSTAVLMICALLLAASLLGSRVPPNAVALHFWSQPITLEFAAGALLAQLHLRGVSLTLAARMALGLGALALWRLIPLSMLEAHPGPGSYGWPRLISFGAGAVLLVAAGTLRGSRPAGRMVTKLAVLGDSSYCLYLFHPFLLMALAAALPRARVPAWALWPSCLATVGVAIALAHGLHLALERPLIARLQKLTARNGAAPVRLMVDA